MCLPDLPCRVCGRYRAASGQWLTLQDLVGYGWLAMAIVNPDRFLELRREQQMDDAVSDGRAPVPGGEYFDLSMIEQMVEGIY